MVWAEGSGGGGKLAAVLEIFNVQYITTKEYVGMQKAYPLGREVDFWWTFYKLT